MPERNRGGNFEGPIAFFVVFALLGIIIFQKSDYEHVESVPNLYEASEYKKRADERISNECAGLDGAAMFQCLNSLEQTARDAHRSQKDLKAQRYMALWAFIMAFGAVVGLVVTFVGLIFIKQTLDATRYTVTATKETGKDETRAYVSVNAVDFFWGGPGRDRPRLVVHIRNAGASPAKWFQLRHGWTVFKIEDDGESSLPHNFVDLALPDGFGRKWHCLINEENGPSAPGAVIDQRIEPEQIARGALDDNEFGFITFGEIRYCTIHDEIFISQFCFGSHGLREYQFESLVRSIDGFEINSRKEIPQPLSRYPMEMKSYEKQEC